MKLKIHRPDFLKSWAIAEKNVATTKDALSVTTSILIEVDVNGVHLAATDFRTSVYVDVKGVEASEEGRILLPASLVGNLIRKMPNDDIEIEVKEGKGFLKCDRSRVRFATQPAEQFPQLPSHKDAKPVVAIPAEQLAMLISDGNTASSTPQDFPKYIGNTLLKVTNDKIAIVATDGKRLSMAYLVEDAGQSADIIIPSAAFKELGRVLMSNYKGDNVCILHDETLAYFSIPDKIVFSIRKTATAFPQWERLLPTNFPTKLQIQQDVLLKAADRILIIAGQDVTKRIHMEISQANGIKLSAETPTTGSSEEVIEEDINIEGDDLMVDFNINFLMDGLKGLGSGEIELLFTGATSASIIQHTDDPDFIYLLMPMSPLETVKQNTEGEQV